MEKIEFFKPNIWYPNETKSNNKSCKSYPSPQNVLRRAVGANDYLFKAEGPCSDHIRAAAVFPLANGIEHLLRDHWSMVYTTPKWRMVMVSCVDNARWIKRARQAGAIAWLKGGSRSQVYIWTPPELDSNGLKIAWRKSLGKSQALKSKEMKNEQTQAKSVVKSFG